MSAQGSFRLTAGTPHIFHGEFNFAEHILETVEVVAIKCRSELADKGNFATALGPDYNYGRRS